MMQPLYCKQIAEATEVVDEDGIYRSFDEVIAPAIMKFQVNTTTSNIGTYILAYARVSTLSEVYIWNAYHKVGP